MERAISADEPLPQGNRAEDQALTWELREDIRSDSSVSQYSLALEIASVDGQIAVRGRVESSKDKQQILSHARKLVGPEKTVDLIAVE